MTVIKKTYTIELSEDDVELITTALHGQYKTESELYQNDDDIYGRYYDAMNKARDLRNTFAKLINRAYMGADA